MVVASAVAETHLDLAYGTHPRHRLDLYLPEGPGPHPVVVWAHGGFWTQGNKAQIPDPLVEFLAEAGYAVASTNYRLAGAPPLFAPPLQYPTNPHPAQVHDYKSAVRYLQDHASQWGLDPAAVFASGYSAGGHIALLSGVSSRGSASGGEDLGIDGSEPDIAGVVGFGAPADLGIAMGTAGPIGEVAIRSLMGCLLSGPCYPQPADPRNYLDADDLPVLLVTGGDDVLVPVSHANSFASTAGAVGYDGLTTRTEPGVVHEDLDGDFDQEFVAGWLESNRASQPGSGAQSR